MWFSADDELTNERMDGRADGSRTGDCSSLFELHEGPAAAYMDVISTDRGASLSAGATWFDVCAMSTRGLTIGSGSSSFRVNTVPDLPLADLSHRLSQFRPIQSYAN